MRRAALTGVVAALLAALHGCLGSQTAPRKTRYVFDIERGTAPYAARGSIAVQKVRVAPIFEHKGFTYRTTRTTAETDFYNEFFARPSMLLGQQIVAWLEESPLFGIVLLPGDPLTPDWLLETRVPQLYGDLRDRSAPVAILAIGFGLFDARSADQGLVLEREYLERVPASEATPGAIFEGWNTALERILTRLEADLADALAER